MSGRKNKNRQRGQRQQRGSGESTELLDELNSLRDLLGSEELADIPLLDQVAEPAPRPARRESRPPVTPLQDTDLPTLFSPEDEEPPEGDPPPSPEPADAIAPELGDTELELLRPLEAIPSPPPASKSPPGEQQQELFAEPAAPPAATENPFLPAHIRARLTGGRVPRADQRAGSRPADDAAARQPHAGADTEADTARDRPPPEAAPPEAASSAGNAPAAEADSAGEAEAGASAAALRREEQRQQLVDRLVARQLPELERQLRARIELMVDELMRNR